MKKMGILAILLLAGLLSPIGFTATPIRFLTLSDIHFDPFIACQTTSIRPCPLIQQLNKAPASEWPALLTAARVELPHYRQDSTYALIQSGLAAAKKVAIQENIQFVVVLGDFLGHNYREYYRKYSRDKTAQGYQVFVKKTLLFLTQQLKAAFPTMSVYAVVGNNDSYHRDYSTDPNGAFLKDTAQTWGVLIQDPVNRANMQKTFVKGGYYAVDVAPHLRLVVLNSVLFSHKAVGKNSAQAADDEFAWLHQTLLAAKAKKQKILIAMHIPAGIDVYATLQYRLFRLIELWNTEYSERFESELKQFSPQLVAILAGHLHSDWFQIVTIDNENKIPVTGTPAISPIFGNNPAFKVYRYSPETGTLEDFETYYFPLTSEKEWRVEYDFNRIYQSTCESCSIIDGMNLLSQTGALAEHYKRFYAVGTTNQPITTRWHPYYWCATREMNARQYKDCIQ